MPVLLNQSKNRELVPHLSIADSFATRSKGLIGRQSMPETEALFFPRCNWIHTFFMSMNIDVIYVDKKMKVRKIQKNLKPWRWPAPVFSAHSVIEFAGGSLNDQDIEIGDTLYVGH